MCCLGLSVAHTKFHGMLWIVQHDTMLRHAWVFGVDPCRDHFLKTCFVRTELLKMEKTLQPKKWTRPSELLPPPSVSLSSLTKCASCPPLAKNPSLSMSCATNMHLRRGFVVQFEFDSPLCDVFFPTLLLTLRACLQTAALCTPNGLLFICRKRISQGPYTKKPHPYACSVFFCASHVYMLCLPLCSLAGS